MATSRLSRLQRQILADVLRYYQWAAGAGDHQATMCRLWGAPVRWLRGSCQDQTAADSAAFSRALRRLEQRGLILRTNSTTGLLSGPRKGYGRQAVDEPHTRTDHVMLTESGKQVAETVKI